MPLEQREHWQELARKDMARFEEEKAQFQGSWKVPANAWQKKDPTKPKKPVPAYFSFSNARRQFVKQQHANASNAEISKILSKMWQEASDELKQQYIDEETKQRAVYVAKLEEWRKKKDSAPPDQNPDQQSDNMHDGDMIQNEYTLRLSASQQLDSMSLLHSMHQQQQAAQAQYTAFLGRPSGAVLASSYQDNIVQSHPPSSSSEGAAQTQQQVSDLTSNESQSSHQQANMILEQFLMTLATTSSVQQSNGGTNSEHPPIHSQFPSASQVGYSQHQVPPQDNDLQALQQIVSMLQGTPTQQNPSTVAAAQNASANPLEAVLNALLQQSFGGQGLTNLLGGSSGVPQCVSPQPPSPPPLPPPPSESDTQAALLRLLLGQNAPQQQGNEVYATNGGGTATQPTLNINMLEMLALPLAPQQAPAPPPEPVSEPSPLEAAIRSLQQQQQQQQQPGPSSQPYVFQEAANLQYQQNQHQHQQQQYQQNQHHHQQQQHNQQHQYQPQQQQQQQQQQITPDTMNMLALAHLLMSPQQQHNGSSNGSSYPNGSDSSNR
jgi:hypothetical protein